jgi:PAS domain S-box-containing protein
MPEMDGISFLRMVRARHRDLPFILLTGRGREEVAVQAFESGADYYVQKGGDPRAQFTELSQKIRRAIRSREAEQRLRENEARYRTLFDQAAAPTLIIDEDMTIAGANEAMAELTGYSREEMDGKLKWPELILPGDRERLMSYHRQRREDPRSAPAQFEAKYIRRTGEVRTALMKVGLIPGTRQSIASLIDLTEQKEAAKRLRESESLFRTLVQATPAFFGTIGADGKTRMMNEAMLRALGYTAEEVEGTDYLATFVPEEDRDALREVFDRLRLGLPTRNQNHIVTKGGRTILCEWQGRPVFRGADLDYFFGVGMDITEQKQAQDRLRESEEQLRLLVDQSPMGMAVFSPDGTLRHADAGRLHPAA